MELNLSQEVVVTDEPTMAIELSDEQLGQVAGGPRIVNDSYGGDSTCIHMNGGW